MEQNQEVKNHGVILGSRDTDFVAGALPCKIINPSGNWYSYLPPGEYQNKRGLETMACVYFSFCNVIETLYYFHTGQRRNFSDRFLATAGGNTINGSYMWQAPEAARNFGLVDEEDWPWPDSVDTWTDYYQPILIKVYDKAREFFKEWEKPAYEKFEPTKENIIKYLKTSPIHVAIPGHAVMCFNSIAQANQYFDSYPPFEKEYGENFVFAQRVVLQRKRPKGIEKVIRKKGEKKCYVVFPKGCPQQIHGIASDTLMPKLGVDFSEVEEVSEQEFNSYAVGGEITEERLERDQREFLDMTCSEWRAKFAPTFMNKVIGIIGLIWERIMDFFGNLTGRRFGYSMEFLGRYWAWGQCVPYVRSRFPHLPHGLWNIWDKKKLINSATPSNLPCVAVIETGWLAGHLAIVTGFWGDVNNPSRVEIEEAGWRYSYITRRVGSPKELRIIGYFV